MANIARAILSKCSEEVRVGCGFGKGRSKARIHIKDGQRHIFPSLSVSPDLFPLNCLETVASEQTH